MGVVEVSLVLGRDTTSLDSWLRMFRDDIVFSSSRFDLVVKGNEIPVTGCYMSEERKGPPY
jgi:hypothetical protein